MRRTVSFAITAYQRILRPLLPAACRFHPTCSEFAKQAVERHGWRGLMMAFGRLLRCHPFHPGGFDPING